MTKPKSSTLQAAARRALLLPFVIFASFAALGDDGANNNNKTIADIYRNAQARILSAINSDFPQRMEDAISSKFPSIRRADIFIHTPLGARTGHFGINAIGAFAEDTNRAFGWQARMYEGEREAWGANAGMFYRQVWNGLAVRDRVLYGGKFLYGGNIFLDYEDSKHGGIFRYGIGGELQNRIFSASANYHIPLTDDHPINNGIAYSRRGVDANLRAALPNLTNWRYLNWTSAEATYYRFSGRAGAGRDSGFRYGAGFSPLGNFHLKLFYDGGAEEFGGALSYTRIIGNNRGSNNYAANDASFAPDTFAPVWREHTQRITTTTPGQD